MQQQGSPGADNYLMLPLPSLQKGHMGCWCIQVVVFNRVLLAEMLTVGLLLQLATVSVQGSSALLRREAAVI